MSFHRPDGLPTDYLEHSDAISLSINAGETGSITDMHQIRKNGLGSASAMRLRFHSSGASSPKYVFKRSLTRVSLRAYLFFWKYVHPHNSLTAAGFGISNCATDLIAKGQPDQTQAALPPGREVPDVHDWVGTGGVGACGVARR